MGPHDPRVLVGFDWADDAGVVALEGGRALVQTVDFFTPVVDDPFTYGAISAANALSDVYAMGGSPLCALNIVGFPDRELPAEILAEILRGGAAKLAESGAALVGGHSIRAPELFYGMSVTGLVDPQRIWRNGGALPGDRLVLTKPLGTGILTTARKRDAIPEEALTAAIASMSKLNRAAAEAAAGLAVRACTDISGFGLAGHAWEMANASAARLSFRFADLPLLAGVMDHAALHCPGGAASNARYVGENLDTTAITTDQRAVVLDPQTSGGLLFAIGADEADVLVARLADRSVDARIVGEVIAGSGVQVL